MTTGNIMNSYGKRTVKKADQPRRCGSAVGLIGNGDGRCCRTRGCRRVIVEDFYNYAPREQYIERRGYHVRTKPDFTPITIAMRGGPTCVRF